MKSTNNTTKKKSVFKSMTFNIVLVVASTLLLFSAAVATVGYWRFTDSLTEQYNDAAFRTAETAATLLNPDHIESYLAEENRGAILAFYTKGREAFDAYVAENELAARKNELLSLAEEYALSLSRLNILRAKQNVTIVYVIAVDTSDYEHFYSVFNCVDLEKYTPWELGALRYTTKTDDNTYQRIYREMYAETLLRDKITRTKNLSGADPHITSLIPLAGSDQAVHGILCVQRLMSGLAAPRAQYTLTVFGLTVFFAALSVLLVTVLLRRQVVKPIKRIVRETERFAGESSAPAEPLGNRISKVNEIKDLARSVDSMEDATLSYIANLSEMLAEKHRAGAELEIASVIQENSLPHIFPPFPGRKEFDLFATMKTAKEVGGDFYDFYMIDDDHLALTIADVSGKGVPAALFMMVNMILLSERALMGGKPSEVLQVVNERICARNKAEMFVTVWLGILEISTGNVIAANAGHDDPLIRKKGGDFVLQKSKHGLVIGAMPTARYKDVSFTLEEGDTLLLYTDGIPEATNAEKKMFTFDGMLSSLNSRKDTSPQTIIQNLIADAEAFVGEAPQFDDMTTLCLTFNGSQKNSITLEADDKSLPALFAFLEERLEKAGCSPKTVQAANLAAEEIFVNIAHYAYAPEKGTAEVAVSADGGAVCIAFVDGGKPYDPLKKPDPDLTLSAEERDIGGLGIFMAKKLATKIEYEYKDGKNILRWYKNIV